MRTLLAIVIAVGLASGADAATVTKKSGAAEATKLQAKAKKKKVKKASKEHVKSEVAKPTQANSEAVKPAPKIEAQSEPAKLVEAAPAAQTSTAGATALAPKPLKKWGASLWSENYAKIIAVKNRTFDSTTSDFESDNLVSLSYKLNPELSISGNTWFNFNPGLGDNKAKSEATDFYLSMSKSNLAKLDKHTAINLAGHVYFPTSETSFNMGLITQLRAYLTLERKMGALTVSYTLNPRYFIQNYLTFETADKKEVGTPYFRIINQIDVGYDITPKWNIATYLGYYNRWSNGDASLNIPYSRVDTALYGTFLGFSPDANLTLLLGLEANGNGATMGGSETQRIYQDDNTDYKLVVNVKI